MKNWHPVEKLLAFAILCFVLELLCKIVTELL